MRRLRDPGILHTEVKPPRQKYETEHYFLKRDLATLRRVVGLVTGHAKREDRHWLSGYRYFRIFVNEAIVREVLREKNVEDVEDGRAALLERRRLGSPL